MAFDAITMISQAEETARKERAQALSDARAAEAAAEEAGKKAVEEASARARKEIHEKLTEMEAAAAAAADQLTGETEKQIAAMRSGAEQKLDAAAELIAERIVKG